MIEPKQKDAILAEIKANTFEYKSLHAEVIEVLDTDGLIDITRTKDGTDVDLTNKGKAFIKDGGYVAAEKEKAKEARKKRLSKALTWILCTVVAAIISVAIERLINP